MSKHTPGPWEVGAGHEVRQVQTGNTLAYCEMERLPWAANARLIAAAPAMLAVLQGIVDELDGEDPSLDAIHDAARQIIADAITEPTLKTRQR